MPKDLLILAKGISKKYRKNPDYEDIQQECFCYLLEELKKGTNKEALFGKARRHMYEWVNFRNKLVQVPPTLENRKALQEAIQEGLDAEEGLWVDPYSLADEGPPEGFTGDEQLWSYIEKTFPYEEATLLTMTVKGGYKVGEVAKVLGITQSKASKLLNKANGKMKSVLYEEEQK